MANDEEPDSVYFAAREVGRPYHHAYELTCFGLGLTIAGFYTGWNGALVYGFWSAVISAFFVTLLYGGVVFSLAELGAAMPYAGGAYYFSRAAFSTWSVKIFGADVGIWVGLLVGILENAVYALSSTMGLQNLTDLFIYITGTEDSYSPLWWLFFLSLALCILCIDMRVAVWFGLLSVAIVLTIVAVLLCMIIKSADFATNALNIPPDPTISGSSVNFPVGLVGMLQGTMAMAWLYMGIEGIVLLSPETKDPAKHIPKALVRGFSILIVFSILVIFINTSALPGANALSKSATPLIVSLTASYGIDTRLIRILMVPCWFQNMSMMLLAASRQVYGLSRTGYLLPILSVVRPKSRIPVWAILFAATVVYLSAALFYYAEHNSANLLTVLYNMCLLSGLISYLFSTTSYVILKFRRPDLVRPYKSPCGIWGAALSIAVNIMCLTILFIYGKLQTLSLIVIGVKVLLAFLYYLFFCRHKMRTSPEEAEQLLAKPKPNQIMPNGMNMGSDGLERQLGSSPGTPSSVNELSSLPGDVTTKVKGPIMQLDSSSPVDQLGKDQVPRRRNSRAPSLTDAFIAGATLGIAANRNSLTISVSPAANQNAPGSLPGSANPSALSGTENTIVLPVPAGPILNGTPVGSANLARGQNSVVLSNSTLPPIVRANTTVIALNGDSPGARPASDHLLSLKKASTIADVDSTASPGSARNITPQHGLVREVASMLASVRDLPPRHRAAGDFLPPQGSIRDVTPLQGAAGNFMQPQGSIRDITPHGSLQKSASRAVSVYDTVPAPGSIRGPTPQQEPV